MRIWWINHYALAPNSAGGTRHFSIGRELASLGHEVMIVSSTFDHWRREHIVAFCPPNPEQIDDVSYIRIPSPGYNDNSIGRFWDMMVFGFRIWRGLWWRALTPPDVIIGSSPHPFAALAGGLLAKRLNVPFVVEIRDIWPATLIELAGLSRHHPAMYVMGRIERWLYKNAKLVVSLLPASREHIIATGGSENQILLIPNGVDLRHWIPQPLDTHDGPFTVMYTGALGNANGLNFLVRAAAILAERGGRSRFRIRVIGSGPQRAQLEDDVRAMRVGDMVTIEDAVPRARIPTLLAEADLLFCHLKNLNVFRWGVSPNKIFDYQAAARPILFATNARENPVFRSGAGIVIPPEQPELIAAAIERVAEMPLEERRCMGLRARAFVAATHEYGILARQLETSLVALG